VSSLYFNSVLNRRDDGAEKCVTQAEVDKNLETWILRTDVT